MPDPFDHIAGHATVLGRLRSALATSRLPHGLLFDGPDGVGKLAVAIALARAFLNCQADRDFTQHPDFHHVTRQLVRLHDRTGKSKALRLTVEVIRKEVVEPANRKSVEGVGKVFVVEEAETMNPAAQNALLKTLEEPAGRTLIVLVTSRADGLLPTIRSRCQRFQFGELSTDDTAHVLQQQGVTGQLADEAIALAGGRPGEAMRFIDDGIVQRASKLKELLGSDALASFLAESADEYAAKQLERDPLGSKDAFTRGGHALYLRLAADVLRTRLVEMPSESLCTKIDAIARAERYLHGNVNVNLTLQHLQLELQ
ncbi:MAG: DNA polymerase III subunit delta' [Planctomycetota bacterium]